MTQSIIDIGDAPNDGTGDLAREAFNKCNNNFTELYAGAGSVTSVTVTPPQGRLTLQTATPVMITTQSAKTTIFYTPYCGALCPIYDGTNMVPTTFAELSNVTTASSTGKAGPAAVAASSVYDLFVWNDAGTVRLTRGPAWTNDTTRSAGTALVRVAGLLLNAVAITNGPAAQRGTYVGTVRSNGSSQMDWILGAVAASGTAGFLGIWNCYNRVLVTTMVGDSTSNWTLASPVIRQANNSPTMRVSFVSGLAEDSFNASYLCPSNGDASGNCSIGVGYDVTGSFTGKRSFTQSNVAGALWGGDSQQSLGFHFFQAIESAGVAGTATFYGNASVAYVQNGLEFTARM